MLQRISSPQSIFTPIKSSPLKAPKALRFGETVEDTSPKTAYEQLDASRRKGVKHALILGGSIAASLLLLVMGDIIQTGLKVQREFDKHQELAASQERLTEKVHQATREREKGLDKIIGDYRQKQFEKKLEAQRQELLGLKEAKAPEGEKSPEASQK